MTDTIFSGSLPAEAAKASVSKLAIGLRRWRLILIASAVSGGLSWIGGMAIGLLSLVGELNTHPRIDRFGTVLLVAAFPLIILAAHCLDRAHEVEKAITIEYCRRTGMPDIAATDGGAKEF